MPLPADTNDGSFLVAGPTEKHHTDSIEDRFAALDRPGSAISRFRPRSPAHRWIEAKPSIPVRSLDAKRVIEDYAARGKDVPNNNSADALHADHVWRLAAEHLDATTSVDEWIGLLRRLATVVCVTARENYALIRVERTTDGPAKYALAGVKFTTTDLPWS